MLSKYIADIAKRHATKRTQLSTQSARFRKRTQAYRLITNAKMNCSIESSKKNAYHTFTNVEFTGVVDITRYNCEYHLFIRYEDKIYMDVKGIGEVVIPFAELQKNKYWKYYYDLSLMLADDKYLVVQELRYSSDYIDYLIYETTRYWWIDNAFIVGDEYHQYGDRGISDIYEKASYYNINPFDLEKMEYTSREDMEVFRVNYMSSSIINDFEKKVVAYNNLAIEYQTKKMEEMNDEIDELSAYFKDLDDKKNVTNLVALYENNVDMSRDLLMMIYENLVGANNQKYYHLVANVGC
jgi:hypothetical protein